MIQPMINPRKIKLLSITLFSIVSIIACHDKQDEIQKNKQKIQSNQQTTSNNASISSIDGTTEGFKNEEIAGKELYKEICSACHDSGILGSPKMGKLMDWKPRIEKGEEAMFISVITGMGDMPARGGARESTDDEIRQAIQYIVKKSQ